MKLPFLKQESHLDINSGLSKALQQSRSLIFIGNVIPLFGVLLWGWELFPIMLLYSLENIVLGVINLVRMIRKPTSKDWDTETKVIFVPVFLIHYGGFCALHTFMVFMMFGSGCPLVNDEGVLCAASYAPLLMLLRDPFFILAFLSMVGSFSSRFIRDELRPGLLSNASADSMTFGPYKRVLLLHIALVMGAFAAMELGSTTIVLALLVLLKTGFDWFTAPSAQS